MSATNADSRPFCWQLCIELSQTCITIEISISFASEPTISTKEFADVLHGSTLGERRPVDDLSRLEGMLRNADATVTARNSAGLLVGISRAISDHHYCTYLSDLAVLTTYQGQGIGKQLI